MTARLLNMFAVGLSVANLVHSFVNHREWLIFDTVILLGNVAVAIWLWLDQPRTDKETI